MRFSTSRAFDLSFLVRHTVGAHVHNVDLTKEDLETIQKSSDGIIKVAYQNKLLFGGIEPGHLFHFVALKSRN